MNRRDEKILDRNSVEITDAYDSIAAINNRLDSIESSFQPPLKGEYYYTDQQLSEILQTSRRTLQEWRSRGYISYIHIGGKLLYSKSDINKLLERFYLSSFR